MKLTVILVLVASNFLSSEAIVFAENWVDAPYFARVQSLTAQFLSVNGGGSIISNRHILTSASILTPNFVTLNVLIGGPTRVTQRIVQVQNRILHENYQPNPRLNDIGLIVLSVDLIFDRFVSPIALPEISQFLPYDNEQGTVLGMGGFPGQTFADLQVAFLRVETPIRCFQRYPAHAVVQQFCGEDTRLRSDICLDDIGGPLVTLSRGNEILVGIATIHICSTNLGVPSEPSLFTRVSNFRNWIRVETQV